MGRTYDQNRTAQFADAVSSPPGVPAAGAGASLGELRLPGSSARFQRITLDASEDQTLTGPVEFGGETNGKVYKLGELNGGDDIVMTAGMGYAEVVQFVGTYEYFWLSPTAISAGTYDGHIEGLVSE